MYTLSFTNVILSHIRKFKKIPDQKDILKKYIFLISTQSYPGRENIGRPGIKMTSIGLSRDWTEKCDRVGPSESFMNIREQSRILIFQGTIKFKTI